MRLTNKPKPIAFVEKNFAMLETLAEEVLGKSHDLDKSELKSLGVYAYLKAKKAKRTFSETADSPIFQNFAIQAMYNERRSPMESLIDEENNNEDTDSSALLENNPEFPESLCNCVETEAELRSYEDYVIDEKSFIRAGCKNRDRIMKFFTLLNGGQNIKTILRLYHTRSYATLIRRFQGDISSLKLVGLNLFKGSCINGSYRCVLVCADSEANARKILSAYGGITNVEPYVISFSFLNAIFEQKPVCAGVEEITPDDRYSFDIKKNLSDAEFKKIVASNSSECVITKFNF